LGQKENNPKYFYFPFSSFYLNEPESKVGELVFLKDKMVLFNGLLKHFVDNLKISDSFASLPYKWNPKSHRLDLKTGSKFVLYKLRVRLATLYLILALLQIAWTWKKAGRMVMTHSAMFVADYVTNITSHFLNSKDPKATVELFNRIIEFEEKRYPKSKLFLKLSFILTI